MLNVKLNLELDGFDIGQQLNQDQALSFINEIDLAFADSEFTESLIKALCKSLKSAYSEQEWEELIKEIK